MRLLKSLKNMGICIKISKKLENDHAKFNDLLYYTPVRWLSKHQCLDRFHKLIDHIDKFFIQRNEKIDELSDPLWKFNLAILVDLTSMLNLLNINLQGKAKLIIDSYENVKKFIKKLTSLIKDIENINFDHFINAKSVLDNNLAMNININLNANLYTSTLKNLHDNFQNRFNDFENKQIFDIFMNPFELPFSELPCLFKIELQEMIENNLETKFNSCNTNESKILFHKSLPDHFINFKNNALKIMSMFSYSYVCEQFFSLLTFRKNKYCSKIDHDNLTACLRILCSDNEPDYSNFVNNS